MLSDKSKQIAAKAKLLYDERYRENLEKSNLGAFVCIEPESGAFFVGNTLDDAANQAIDAYPDRLTHTLRIGYSAALHFRSDDALNGQVERPKLTKQLTSLQDIRANTIVLPSPRFGERGRG